MDRRDAIAWVLSVCVGCLRRSQAKTLSVLVAAAMRCPRMSLANLGRQMRGSAWAKHRIKRAWRFIANDRIEPTLAMRGVIHRLVRNRRKPLLVSFDWTDIRGLQTLMASAVVQGRSIPLCWASCHKHTWQGHRSRNGFEQSLLLTLRAMIPPQLPVILLADRGFGRTELGRFCQRYHFSYIFRIQPKVWIHVGQVRCRLDQYPIHKGMCQMLKAVLYRQHDPIQQNVVVRWKRHLPKHRDECWYLMTDLNLPARRVSDLYARRMSIEQLFRDGKNKRNGWSLRDTGLRQPDRLDRLILILALAYLLLVGLGLIGQRRYRPGHWSSNNRPDAFSLFQIGLYLLDQLRLKPADAFNALVHATESEFPKWG